VFKMEEGEFGKSDGPTADETVLNLLKSLLRLYQKRRFHH
jgi:hypothetical protein